MGADGEECLPALEVMRQWQWVRFDPDGFPLASGLDLSEVVNRLAMAGLKRPDTKVLALLCLGHLDAVGDYRWKKYQWGKYYSLEDCNAKVAANQWQMLQTIIEEGQRELANHGWPFDGVDLKKLGLENCSSHEWEYGENRFSIALCPPETPIHDSSYFEEWFSASNLEIRFPDASPDAVEIGASLGPVESPSVGRPLAAWWPDFVAEIVAYAVEVGMPEGVGHQGQSVVIKDVCTRLQERNKEEPSRTQIQEAVNAVLRRMRSAGN